jgi:uncharacterized protein
LLTVRSFIIGTDRAELAPAEKKWRFVSDCRDRRRDRSRRAGTLYAMKVLVSGATGLIGSALVERLAADGHQAVRLVRGDPRPGDVVWDPKAGTLAAADLAGIEGVVHLAGAGIADHRWTDEYKREIRSSRLTGTDLLARTIAGLERPPAVLVSGSAIGIYGDRGDEVLDERSPHGTGFLVEVCEAWEAATAPAEDAGVRVAHIRTGIVLSPHGGALKQLLPLFKFGLGGKIGSGKQWQSWIALDDEVGAIVHLLTAGVTGPVNLTAPNPVTNAELSEVLAHVLHRPRFPFVPAFGPKLLLGTELAENLVLTGQQVLPGVLQASGYRFAFEQLEPALRALLDKPAR